MYTNVQDWRKISSLYRYEMFENACLNSFIVVSAYSTIIEEVLVEKPI